MIEAGNSTKLSRGAEGSLSAASRAAMPNMVSPDEQPKVSINGVVYEWKTGEEDGVPPEALAVWQAAREATA